MMTHTEALDRVQKLLKLAKSDNANEAAVAASMAQKIIDTFKFSTEALSGENKVKEEVLTDTLDADGYGSWKGRLAMVVAKANGCKAYKDGRSLALIGRPSDIQTVKYLYSWLVREIDGFVRNIDSGLGRTYYNNFRLGAVSGIGTQLTTQRKTTQNEVQAKAQAEGEVAVNNFATAIVRIDAEYAEVEAYGKEKLRLRARPTQSTRFNENAYSRGQQAGRGVTMNSRATLGQGAGRLAG